MSIELPSASGYSQEAASDDLAQGSSGRLPVPGDDMQRLAIVTAELARLLDFRSIFQFDCGTGQFLRAVSAELKSGGGTPDVHISGLDLSGLDLGRAAGAQERRVDGIRILEGSESRLEAIPESAFDLILTMAPLSCRPDLTPVLPELVRIARSALILIEPDEGSQGAGATGGGNPVQVAGSLAGGIATDGRDRHSMFAEVGARYVGSLPLAGRTAQQGLSYRLHVISTSDDSPLSGDAALRTLAERIEILQPVLQSLERILDENRKLKSEIELMKLWSAEALQKEIQAAERRVRLSELEHRVGSIVLKDRFRVWAWPLVPMKLGVAYLKYRRYRKYADLWDPRMQRTMRDNLLNELHKPPQKRTIEPIDNRVCYVLHNSLPYASGGYATRGHGLARGLVSQGFEVIALTRPGFPADVHDMPAVEIKDHTIDGVHYRRIISPGREGKPKPAYMIEIIAAFEAAFREIRPSIVVAASFYVSAIPAMIAARRLGIPFIYELRGLAEITKISRDPSYRITPAYQEQVLMETETGQWADHMFTLTQAMRDESVARGIDRRKITLLPNSCDPEKFSVMPRDSGLAARYGFPEGIPVIGYIGTIVDYEGLDDLMNACALLKKRGLEFRVMIVGSETATGQPGAICSQIAATSKAAGLDKWLVMPGRVPHEEVKAHYSLIDIAPFPRKPWPVCEMVSPMKPLEAFAMEKAVVVSSVAALSEMVRHGETGMVFEKGNVSSLAEVLEELIRTPDLRTRLGRAGRQYVNEQRTWARTASIAADIIRETIKRSGQVA